MSFYVPLTTRCIRRIRASTPQHRHFSHHEMFIDEENQNYTSLKSRFFGAYRENDDKARTIYAVFSGYLEMEKLLTFPSDLEVLIRQIRECRFTVECS